MAEIDKPLPNTKTTIEVPGEVEIQEAIKKMDVQKLKHGYFDFKNNDLGTTPHAGIGILRDYELDDKGELVKKNSKKTNP